MKELLGNRYSIVEKIGAGGMADVYLAVDTVLDREVAIKELRGDLSHDPVALLRFQREASAASGLNHPNIVGVYDVGEDDQQHYIVMELMRGSTLKKLIHRRGSLEKREAVSIIEQLTNALIHAHEKKIIHRDIKPQNILVQADGTVKIADFGIALAGDALQLTKSDSVLGSVHYLAPECSRGEGATEQSDIYALGVVLYELLVGDVPYHGETAVEIAMKHMREPFPSIQDVNSSLPNSLVNIIAKATAKNRAYRYHTMHEFSDDLKTALNPERQNEPLWSPHYEEGEDDHTKVIEQIGKVKAKKKVERLTKKQKWLLGGAGATLLLILGFVLWWFLTPNPIPQVKIPNLEGKSLADAQKILTEHNLVVDPQNIYEYSDKYDKDIVIKTNPELDSEVDEGSNIRLVVSGGKTYTVEDYSGLHVDDVKSKLAGYQVNIQLRNEVRPDIAPGTIIRQDLLMPGDVINPDVSRNMTLYISSEAEAVIPGNIIGLSLEEAQQILNNLNLESRIEKLPLPNNLNNEELNRLQYGVVIRSNPNAGTYYVQKNGSIITLYYYDINDKPELSRE